MIDPKLPESALLPDPETPKAFIERHRRDRLVKRVLILICACLTFSTCCIGAMGAPEFNETAPPGDGR